MTRTTAGYATLKQPIAVLIISLAVLAGCAVNPVGGNRELVLMSEDQELAVGRENHAKVLQTYGKYDGPALQRFVQEVGEKLAAQSHRPELYYRFTLLDSADVNAFALPGGYIYITRGMLAYLNSEAELAAVLGHEIGHVTARHGVRQQTASTLAGLGVTLGQILVPELRGQAAQQLTNVLGTAVLSGYGRDHELQADGLAAEYLAQSGYDPRAILEVLGLLKNQSALDQQLAKEEGREPRAYHGLFATHPDNDTRLQEIIGKVQFLAPDNKAAQRDDSFLHKLDGLVYGDSPAQGIRRNNHFYHEAMGIALSFPEGWLLKNEPERVLAAAPGGHAYAELRTEDLNKKMAPRDFLQRRLGGRDLTMGEEISPDGLPGYTALTRVNTAKGVRPARVAVIYKDTSAYLIIGVVLDGATDRIDDDLRDTINSFHRLKSEEKNLARPLRLHLAPTAGNFAQLAKESSLPHHAEATLRLLNHYYPDGEAETGALIKVVK